MQSVKVAIKNIGVPHAGLGVVSQEQLDQELQYNYLSQGYGLQNTHYLGAVPNADGTGIQGYKFAFVFVKNDPQDQTPVGSVGEPTSDGVEKRKPGRPAKV